GAVADALVVGGEERAAVVAVGVDDLVLLAGAGVVNPDVGVGAAAGLLVADVGVEDEAAVLGVGAFGVVVGAGEDRLDSAGGPGARHARQVGRVDLSAAHEWK